MVLPVDIDFLVSSSLSMPEHNQQLLEMITSGAAIVIPAWEPTAGTEAGQQAATDAVLGKLALACMTPQRHQAVQSGCCYETVAEFRMLKSSTNNSISQQAAIKKDSVA